MINEYAVNLCGYKSFLVPIYSNVHKQFIEQLREREYWIENITEKSSNVGRKFNCQINFLVYFLCLKKGINYRQVHISSSKEGIT